MLVVKLTDEERMRLSVLNARVRDFEDAHAELQNYKKSLRQKYFPEYSPFDSKGGFDEAGGFIVRE